MIAALPAPSLTYLVLSALAAPVSGVAQAASVQQEPVEIEFTLAETAPGPELTEAAAIVRPLSPATEAPVTVSVRLSRA